MSARRAKTFRSPRIWADVALLVVVLPVGIAALAFLLAIVVVPLSLIAGIELADRQLIPFCLALAAVIVVFWTRTKVVWSFTLLPAGVRIGSVWPTRVRYEAIKFIKAGRDFTPSVDPHGLTPVSIALGWFLEYRVLLRDTDAQAWVKKVTIEQRGKATQALRASGYETIPSDANFFMVNLRRPVAPLIDEFEKKGVLVGRPFPPLNDHLRVSVGTPDEMDRFMVALKAVMATRPSARAG